MTLFATICIDSPVLEASVERAGDATVDIEQQPAASDGRLDLTVWCACEDPASFERGMDADETVERWIGVGRTDQRRLYQVRLTADASATFQYHEWADGRAVVLSGRRDRNGWVLNTYLQDRSVLEMLSEGCESAGVRFDLLQVSEIDRLQHTQQFGLSEVQAKTLLAALERGYYSVPRETNLEELAEPLEVSHQAVSERLRRGICSLLENTIGARSDEYNLPLQGERAGGSAVEDTEEAEADTPALSPNRSRFRNASSPGEGMETSVPTSYR